MKNSDKSLLVGDVVIFYQNAFPAGFMQILEITPDKPNWWKVKLVNAAMGGFEFYWILDANHLNQEEFTMSGIPCRLQLYARPKVEEKSVEKSKDIVVGMPNSEVSTNSNSLFGDM